MQMQSRFLFVIFTILIAPLSSHATPTTLFYTPVTTDVVPYKSIHLDVDDYFTLNRRDVPYANNRFPTDIGLTYGLFQWENLQGEIGVDYFAATLDPWYFNAKASIPENFLFEYAPSAAIGIFNLGTRHRNSYRGRYSTIVHSRTDQNIAYYSIGKTLFKNARLFVGGYHLNSFFGVPNGYLLGLEYNAFPTTYCDGTEYFKATFCGDWASGKNVFGGGGFGVTDYFTPGINIETGPAFFNSTRWNGRWKWSVQLNVTLPVFL